MMIPPLVQFTDQAWSSSPSRWHDTASYAQACLLDGQLPIQEPDGRFNVLAMDAAAQALPTMSEPVIERRMAARTLIRLMHYAKRPISDALMALAANRMKAESSANLRARLAAIRRHIPR